ncbi:phenylalanine--tRNA ligase subunit beta [Rothia sp. P7208]|uniref:phenylalanine--tRNA ligase subunit beta n=1 Tax=Rothia sp. P7208 TaxID=3402660 RepID=UPI003AD2763C
MRIPLSWLREYAPVPEEARSEDVMETLVKVGLEEEDVHRPTDEISGPIVIGQVLSQEPETHSNGKTVNWCQVRVVPEGQTQTLTGKGIEESGIQGIICGAHNFSVGDKVVVTLPGAVLPGGFAITARKTYGHKSAGMLASARELGLGEDTGGIIVLSDLGLDPEIGTDAMELLGLYDEAAEVNVTPDRGYAFSIRGIAREYCHAVGEPFHDFVTDLAERAPQTHPSDHEVTLNDEAPIHGKPGCTRFVTRKVTNVASDTPTPLWLASRLRLAGIRSVSLPVDISNYVMLETGQPLHFYDAQKLSGSLSVRRAREGETLLTLDEKERTLHPEDLVICDDSGAIALAGVMGGASTEVTAETREILIESARFDEVSIARSSRRHKLSSDASKRFERGVDSALQAAAAQRAVELLVELAGATIAAESSDVNHTVQPQPIFLPTDYTESRIGVAYTQEEIVSTLESIGAQVKTADDVYEVLPPTWRPDLTDKEDLTEEVARLIGYDKIPSTVPVAPPGRGYTVEQMTRRRVLDALASSGMTEVYAYPFVSAQANNVWAQPVAGDVVASIQLANPISEAQGFLRRSLLPGLMDVLKRNISRGFRNLALYETGHIFVPSTQHGSESIPGLGKRPSDEVIADLNAGIPHQPRYISGVFCGDEHEQMPGTSARAYDWRDTLDAVGLIADVAGAEFKLAQGTHQAFHPGRTAVLFDSSGTVIGYAGELHPQLLKEHDLPERTCAFEINFSALLEDKAEVVEAYSIFGYPAATQDVALLVDVDVPAADVALALSEGAGELLEDLRIFDDYRGEGIPEGKKSVAFALRFRASDRTLTAEEASASREAAVAVAVERFGAVPRV